MSKLNQLQRSVFIAIANIIEDANIEQLVGFNKIEYMGDLIAGCNDCEALEEVLQYLLGEQK